MPCFLVEMLVDNCTEEIQDTQDIGLASTVFGPPACSGLSTVPNCTNTTVTPSGLTLDCTIVNPTCSVVGYSPDPVNPALTNVLFSITYSESLSLSEAGDGSCTVSTSVFTRLKMVQLTTSSVSQPLTYACILDNYACGWRLVNEANGCHVITNAVFCVEFISTTTVKQEIASSACVATPCDPFPSTACPPVA